VISGQWKKPFPYFGQACAIFAVYYFSEKYWQYMYRPPIIEKKEYEFQFENEVNGAVESSKKGGH
jgi:hypothetical protein